MTRGIDMIRARGFTMTELLIVVAVIGILASIALPAYNNYTFRARRADGQHLLQNVATAQERYYSTYNRFTGSLSQLGFTGAAKSDSGYYTATVTVSADNLTYTATAAPGGSQSGDKCGSLTVTNAGVKGKSGDESNGKCW